MWRGFRDYFLDNNFLIKNFLLKMEIKLVKMLSLRRIKIATLNFLVEYYIREINFLLIKNHFIIHIKRTIINEKFVVEIIKCN